MEMMPTRCYAVRTTMGYRPKYMGRLILVRIRAKKKDVQGGARQAHDPWANRTGSLWQLSDGDFSAGRAVA